MPNPRCAFLLVVFSLCLPILPSVAPAREPEPGKLQVFILAGQSNMVGHAKSITLPRLFADQRPEVRELSKLVFKPDTVVTREMVDKQIAVQIARDELNRALRGKEVEGEEAIAAARKKLEALTAQLDDLQEALKASFAVSDSVYVTSIADRNRRSGPLTVGFGGSEEKVGPELGFGMSMSHRIKSPILLIKTAWGGKSLHYNFRPPSAGPYELSDKQQAADDPEKIRQDAGLNYRLMTEQVHAVLKDLKKHHPQYDAEQGYDLAGFVWFQGFNDQFSDAFRDNYKDNMINFVRDVRREFDAPRMPFVIGVMGTGVTAEKVGENAVSVAQREAASSPELRDNVTSVESYEVYDLSALEVFNKGWRENFAEWCAVGSDRPYHYLGSGKFFVRFGDRLAAAMAELIARQTR